MRLFRPGVLRLPDVDKRFDLHVYADIAPAYASSLLTSVVKYGPDPNKGVGLAPGEPTIL